MKKIFYFAKSNLILLFFAFLCIACIQQAQAQIYVKADATGANDGSSWANAYTNLQSALAAATATAPNNKIYIAAGTYIPTQQFDFDGNGADPREVTFQIPDGVEVYGGFAGTETTIDLAARDLVANVTILSGDINGDDSFSAPM